MNSVLKRILETGSVETPNGEVIKAGVSPIPREEGEFLQEIIRRLKPRTTLEVGLAFGVSALYVCDALAEVQAERHIVIDPNQFKGGWGGVGMHNLKTAGFESLIEFYGLPSYLALPQLVAEGRKIDFAFIDGWHTFDYVLVDFFYIDKLLREGGVVVFDDANYPSIRKVCRYAVTNRAYAAYSTPGAAANNNSTLKRKLLFNAPVISGRLKSITRSDVLHPDSELGLPLATTRYIALVKQGEDVLGDGSGGTRRWDFHVDF